MKARVLTFAFVALMLAGVASAQTINTESAAIQPWIGVWQATLDGQPGVTLTLATDTGALAGTVVFNIVSRGDGQPRVLASQPHVLLNPRLDGTSLSFQARRLNGSLMNFTVSLVSDGHASIHCLDCSPDAPIAELARAPLTPQ